jgi:hypothetical protein
VLRVARAVAAHGGHDAGDTPMMAYLLDWCALLVRWQQMAGMAQATGR